MRLLNTSTARLLSFPNPDTRPPYAILSHVWQEHEASFQDIEVLSTHPDPLSVAPEKIRRFCLLASAEGFDWLWLDTCCIDKTSSSELSEALNSMYVWYQEATICYVYLHDVPPLPDGPCTDPDDQAGYEESLINSVWFTRGWTLQELLAPHFLFFLSYDWSVIGTKHSWASAIQRATQIDQEVLTLSRPLQKVSIARRMSWAAKRRTTRPEDRAYSLLGLFGVNMAPIYGEGPERAFYRLQEQILTHCSPDQSIFAWGAFNLYDCLSVQSFCSDTEDDLGHLVGQGSSYPERLLASSPDSFASAANIIPVSQARLMDVLGIQTLPHSMETYITGFGIRVTLPLIPIHHHPNIAFLAVLACQDSRLPESLFCLYLRKSSNIGSSRLHAIGAFTPKLPQDMRRALSGSSAPRQLRLHRGGLLFDPLPPAIQQSITAPTFYILHKPQCPGHRSQQFRGRCFERVARMYVAAGKQVASAFRSPDVQEFAWDIAHQRTVHPSPTRSNLVSIPDIIKSMISNSRASASGRRLPLLLPSFSTTGDCSNIIWETLRRIVFDMPSHLKKRTFTFQVVFEGQHSSSLPESDNLLPVIVRSRGTLLNHIPPTLDVPLQCPASLVGFPEVDGAAGFPKRQLDLRMVTCQMVEDGYTARRQMEKVHTSALYSKTVLSFSLSPSSQTFEHVDDPDIEGATVHSSEEPESVSAPHGHRHKQASRTEEAMEKGKIVSTYTWSTG
ncbi:heterokaryon incompatibility protein-domain-containing protein [Lenzites betulinus]|nr:heterokaryon incompatibility protein-domain-containing protein [Lenzites betulinus]